ncbi:efflux transporter outer membrane subunit [Thalassobaculum sp. OXR-137]|uniref:efflux transporter outer membrane subunit n=1 Tax=Thalassobaculum sp. OXR-137 TaxID=3100173 RepID=UPI002AC94D10|nr:efflux transporter outer membrane subunit [Thalassobaculum sp. OXR-137]WPZ32397.1 efflux transporter outer membrane subunit [Thalassobaculum sp. OXR-137]
MSVQRTVAALGLCLLASGCAIAPDWTRPSAPVPGSWSQETAPSRAAPAALPAVEAVAPSADWWRRFGSAELDRLMALAMDENVDLATARYRIQQARAALRSVAANRVPSLDASGNVSRDQNLDGGGSDSRWTGGLTLSYDVDPFGGIDAQVDSAEYAVLAEQYGREATRLVMESDLAALYFTVLSTRQRTAIAQDNLAAAVQVLDLVEARVRAGAATELDLAQQRSAVAGFRAQLAALEQQQRVAMNGLAVLIGRPPGAVEVRETGLRSLTLPRVATGQPSDLLLRRPDLRRAEATLRASDADVAAARAAFYPTATISVGAAVSGAFDGGVSTLASLASGLAAPIFDGGRLQGQFDAADARRLELLETYRGAVLTAFRETEDAMAGVDTGNRRVEDLAMAAEQAGYAYELSRIRYEAGAADFLTVLDAQRTKLSADDTLVQAQLSTFLSAADLFVALGGGWDVVPAVGQMSAAAVR